MDLEQGFKDAMSCWASGVSVVTVRDALGNAYGVTVSSFSSVSLRPPLVLVCLNNDNRLPAMAEAEGGFAVSILAWGQQDASNWFASRGRVPQAALEIPCDDAPNGHPVVKDSAGWVCCDLKAMHIEGDHTILIGAVTHTFADPERTPLLYYRRDYHTLGA